MGKKTPKAPAAPDPVATAAAQTQSNRDTAYWNAVLNNVNQITPYGNLIYTQTGGGKTYNEDGYNNAMAAYQAALNNYNSMQSQQNNGEFSGNNQVGSAPIAPRREDFLIGDAPPSFTSTITLSPEQQAIYDTMTAQQRQLLDIGGRQIGRISDAVADPYSYAGLGDAPTAESIAEQQLRAEEALMSRLNPQFGRDEEAMRTRLINQGIAQGSEAYDREMDTFNQMKNDARVQAILGGQQYGTTAQNQALQRRNQAIQEYGAQRTAPLNEYIGFTSGTQVQNPQFQNINYGGAAGTDIAGLVQNKYNADYQNYANKVATRNQNMATLGQLGGMALSAGMGGGGMGFGGMQAIGGGPFNLTAYQAGLPWSDKRLKTDIIEDGKENGHKMYQFRYIGDDTVYRGVMAQDIEKTNPDAVVAMPSGFKAVKYDMLGISMEAV